MKITLLSVCGFLETLERCIAAFWETLTGASKPLVVPAAESAVRVDSQPFSQRKAFSGSDSANAYLMFIENGLYQRVTLSKSVTTVASEGMDCRVTDSDEDSEDSLEFLKRNDRYYLYVKERDAEGGAYLNGERLAAGERKELKPLDAIQIAHTTLVFLRPDAAKRPKEAEGQ